MMESAPHYLLFSESRATGMAEDGQAACPSGRGQWRFVLETIDGQIRLEAADEESGAEEDRLALLSVVRGLEALEQPSRVTVVTTSRYVSRGFLFGLQEWRDNGWRWERFGEMTPIKNRDLWQRVDQAMQYHQVQCRVWRFDLPETPAPRSAAVATASPSRRCAPSAARHSSPRSREHNVKPGRHAAASWGQRVRSFWQTCRTRLRDGILRLEAA